MSTDPSAASRRFWALLIAGVLIVGAVYVGLRLTPSSYGIVLRELGVPGQGLIAGTPRVERGDEYGWHTPLLQMAVRSRFQRHDITPPYFEDLRGLYATPILDWGLIFKPQLWAFFVLRPAVAYSLYHFLLIASFVVGFTVLFVRLGGRDVDSLLMAFILFFSSYTQHWWNAAANFFFPFFPWLVVVLLSRIRFTVRLLLFFWLLVTALLTYFYPPNAIALAFVAATLIAAFEPRLLEWRRLLALLVTAGAAAVVVVLYLWAPITALSTTTYPGHRIGGGGGIGLARWLTQFVPTAQMRGDEMLDGSGVCEPSMIGSVFALIAVIFLPWKELLRRPGVERRRLVVLFSGLVATQAWMTLPIPAWAGYPLLWHRVPPGRMLLAGGLLLLILTFVATQSISLVFSFARFNLFAGSLLFVWCYYKNPAGVRFLESYKDWAIILALGGIALLVHFAVLDGARARTALLFACGLLGFLSFGFYNPLQSAEPIFRKPDSPVLREFDERLKASPRGYIVQPWGTSFFAHTGLPLIGLGYPSLSYSTFVPALDLWRKLYPDLTPGEVQELFNNAGGFAFGYVDRPQRVPGTLVTMAPLKPLEESGVNVCDLIPPSRIALRMGSQCAGAISKPRLANAGRQALPVSNEP